MTDKTLIISGLVPLTTIDYPTKLSMVIFLQGCPWRCPYCYNLALLAFKKPTAADKENYNKVLNLLKKRSAMLDAVVFSGGEATYQTDAIIQTINDIKQFAPHFNFGLHTNGCFPERVKQLLPFINWVGLDIKAPPEKYDLITKMKNSYEPVLKTLDILLDSGISFETRTTADPTFLNKDDILKIATFLKRKGVKNYAIQKYRPVNKDDPNNPSDILINQFFNDEKLKEKLHLLIPNLELRC